MFGFQSQTESGSAQQLQSIPPIPRFVRAAKTGYTTEIASNIAFARDVLRTRHAERVLRLEPISQQISRGQKRAQALDLDSSDIPSVVSLTTDPPVFDGSTLVYPEFAMDPLSEIHPPVPVNEELRGPIGCDGLPDLRQIRQPSYFSPLTSDNAKAFASCFTRYCTSQFEI